MLHSEPAVSEGGEHREARKTPNAFCCLAINECQSLMLNPVGVAPCGRVHEYLHILFASVCVCVCVCVCARACVRHNSMSE